MRPARLDAPDVFPRDDRRGVTAISTDRKFPGAVRVAVLVATAVGSWTIVFVVGLSLLYIFRHLFRG